MPLSERQMNRASFQTWGADQATDNKAELERLKSLLPIVLSEVCAEKQKKYIYEYFSEGRTFKEIADIYGVNDSSVCRTVHCGMKRIYKHMKYASPMLLDSEVLSKRARKILRKSQQKR